MRGPLIFLGVVVVGGAAVLALRSPASEADPPAVAAIAEAEAPVSATPATALADDALPVMTVYKAPTCACCGDWVEHMRAAGFTVEVEDVADMASIKNRHGVPGELSSCHTALIGDYIVEGHVPADDVKRLLADAPDALGITAPGMPIGSPGMEVEGQPAQPFDVLSFTADGRSQVFARH